VPRSKLKLRMGSVLCNILCVVCVKVVRNASSNDTELYANVGTPIAASISSVHPTKKSSRPTGLPLSPPVPNKPTSTSTSGQQVAQFVTSNYRSSNETSHQHAEESGLQNVYENFGEAVSLTTPVKRH